MAFKRSWVRIPYAPFQKELRNGLNTSFPGSFFIPSLCEVIKEVIKTGIYCYTNAFSVIPIMRTALRDLYVAIPYAIYKTVCVVYPAAPKTAQISS